MTKTDARKILGISTRADIKSAERVYLQKRENLRLHMLQGNPRPVREQARDELVELTNAWNAMQIKRTTKRKRSKPKATVNRQKPAKQTTVWDVIHDLAENWKTLIGMTSLSKTTVLAILIAEFVLVIITLVLKSMKGV